MNKISLITKTTFLELIREKLFIVIIFVSIGFLFLSIALSNLSIFEYQRILVDLSLSCIEFSCLGIALFVGSSLLNKEIEKQTCLLLLSKPIERKDFLLGKFLGLSLLILLNLVILVILMNIIIFDTQFITSSIYVLFNILFKILVVLSLVIFLSTSIRPVIALMFGFSFYLYGHGIENVEFLIKRSKDENQILLYKFLELASPQFYHFNWKSIYYLKQPVSFQEFLLMILYFSIWILLFLVLSIRIFNKKDIV